MNLMTIDDISQMLKLSRTYVRDRLVKNATFPRPCLFISQKNRRWEKDSVERWIANSKESLSR